jgi:hypothetical protein
VQRINFNPNGINFVVAKNKHSNSAGGSPATERMLEKKRIMVINKPLLMSQRGVIGIASVLNRHTVVKTNDVGSSCVPSKVNYQDGDTIESNSADVSHKAIMKSIRFNQIPAIKQENNSSRKSKRSTRQYENLSRLV